jgi:hypothetical protein
MMESESFRVPETLNFDSDGCSELLDDWVRSRANNLGIDADDVAELTRCVKQRGRYILCLSDNPRCRTIRCLEVQVRRGAEMGIRSPP